ncbi:MAG TPA: ASCH domain-containing protein [Cytophagales bacterium]|nr:ASCH domain-containing protein [Cytophagales bacterium]
MLLGFKPQFAEPIIKGTKIHTLRNEPKRMPKIGETLHMYTGLRTRNCKLIRNDLKLVSITRVTLITRWDHTLNIHSSKLILRYPNYNVNLDNESMQEFFINDGFKDQSGFTEFWKKNWAKDEIPLLCFSELYMFSWKDTNYSGLIDDLPF